MRSVANYFIFRKLTYQSSLWFDEGPILAVHFVIETTGIAQIMTVAITPPKGRGSCSTINTLTPF